MLSSESIVVAHVVSRNSARTIVPCLRSLLSQNHFILGKTLFLAVTDNASQDDTVSLVTETFGEQVEVISNRANTGFSGGHNAGISRALAHGADYIFIFNPDAVLEPNSLWSLLSALECDPRAGFATPKLYRADENLEPVTPSRFDAAGMFITRELRHFDRGSEELDQGQYNTDCYVFGGSGAAVLLRRDFVLDLALERTRGQPERIEVFDNDFFAYREDADLSWRAQILGWKCRYVPSAIGYHERRVLPERRKSMPELINSLGVQNRFLLQVSNFSFLSNAHCLLPTIFRNFVVCAAVFTVERSSLPGLKHAFSCLPRTLEKRREIFRRRRAHPLAVAKWFRKTPVTEPILLPSDKREFIRSLKIIIINFNSGTRLRNALASLSKCSPATRTAFDLEAIIFDNASADDSFQLAKRIFSNTHWFSFDRSARNLGFAGGINQSVQSHPGDAYLILNPDVTIEESAIKALVDALENYPQLGAVAPLLVSEDNRIQKEFLVRDFPSLMSTLIDLFFVDHLWPNNPWTSFFLKRGDNFIGSYLDGEPIIGNCPKEDLSKPLLVEQPPGACLLIRDTAFAIIGGFDTGFYPAWFEDVDFEYRLRKQKFLCAITRDARVIHEGGYSAKALGAERFASIWYTNLIRYWKKHGTRREYLTLRLMLPLAQLLKSVLLLLSAALFSKTSTGRADALTQAKSLFSLALRGGNNKAYQQIPRESLKESTPENQSKELPSGSSARRNATTPPESERQELTHLLPAQGSNKDSLVHIESKNMYQYFSSLLHGKGYLQAIDPNQPSNGHNKNILLSTERWKQLVPECAGLNIEQDAALGLNGIHVEKDSGYDFVISSFILEHTPNPIQALLQCLKLLKPGAFLYLIAGDKRLTSSRFRPRTTLEHLVLDFERPSSERDFEHYLEHTTLVLNQRGNAAVAKAQALATSSQLIPYHAFLPEDSCHLFQWISQTHLPNRIWEGPVKTGQGPEFHLLIEKLAA